MTGLLQTKLVESLGENPLAKLEKTGGKPGRPGAAQLKRKGTRRGSLNQGEDTPETELLENALMKITELLQIGAWWKMRLRPSLLAKGRGQGNLISWGCGCPCVDRLRCCGRGDHRQEHEGRWWRRQGRVLTRGTALSVCRQAGQRGGALGM